MKGIQPTIAGFGGRGKGQQAEKWGWPLEAKNHPWPTASKKTVVESC